MSPSYDDDSYDDYEPDIRRSRRRQNDDREPAIGHSRRRYEDELDEGHSVIGITSFVIALIAGLLTGASFVAAIVMTFQAGRPLNDKDPQAMLAGCGILAGLALALVGAVVAIIGLAADRHHKQVFSYIGLTINGVHLLGGVVLMCFGLAAR